MEIETRYQDLAPAQLDLALKSVWARCLSAVRTAMICSLSLWTSIRAKQTRLSAPRSESRAKSEKFLTFYRICIFIPRLFEYLYFKRFYFLNKLEIMMEIWTYLYPDVPIEVQFVWPKNFRFKLYYHVVNSSQRVKT